MINSLTSHVRDWIGVLLLDKRSVDYVNKLFADGWSVVESSYSGLPVFAVRTIIDSPPDYDPSELYIGMPGTSTSLKTATVLILRLTGKRDKYQIKVVDQDEITQRVDLSTVEIPPQYKLLGVLSLAHGSMGILLEKA